MLRFVPRPAATRAAAYLLVALAAQAASSAQEGDFDLTELGLEELMALEVEQVVGASRRRQSVADAPSSVTVITAAQIRDHGYRTLADVLRATPGMHLTYDRNYSYIGVRGYYVPGDYNSRILLLVDGHRLNYGVYGGASIGFESPIDVATLERIEVIRGPGSSLYGSNAFFAVVNLVTRRAAENAGVRSTVEAGDEDTYLARGGFGAVGEDGDGWSVSARAYSSHGAAVRYDEFSGLPGGEWNHGGDFERAQQAQVRWDRGSWTLSGAMAWRDKGIPTGSFDTVLGEDNRTRDVQGFLDLSWSESDDDGSSWLASLRYDDYEYQGRYYYDDSGAGGPPDLLYRDRTIARTLSAEVLHSRLGRWSDRWTFGAEVRWNFDADQWNWDEISGVLLDDERDSINSGVFAQDEIELDDSSSLILGARADLYEALGGVLVPRAAYVRHLSERTTLKLLYGEAFRAPTEYERYYDDGSSQIGNPDLDPERIKTLEAVITTSSARFGDFSAAVFHNEIDDLIALTSPGGGVLVFDNIAASEADGVELEYVKRWSSGARLRLSQSFQELTDESTGDLLPNAPRRLTQALLESNLWTPKLRVGVELIGVGSRGTLAGDTADSHWLTNLVLRAPNLAPGLEAYVRANNVFDVDYSDPVSAELVQDQLRQDGFRLQLGLTLSR